MKAAGHHSQQRFAARAGFTIIELLVASAIGVLIVAGAYFFLIFSLRAMAGVSSQSVLTQTGGNTMEVIQKRIRFATTNYVSSTGNTLTLGFDDDPTANADGVGRAYDDRTHFEQFKFIGVNSTNAADCKTNQLIYIPNTNSANRRVLISAGVRNLPGYKIFSSLTNSSLVIIRFGIADPSSIDHYQAIDLQGTGVSLNRLWTTNVISIYP